MGFKGSFLEAHSSDTNFNCCSFKKKKYKTNEKKTLDYNSGNMMLLFFYFKPER